MEQRLNLQDCDCGFLDTKDPTARIYNSLLIFDFTKATWEQFHKIFIKASYAVKKSQAPYTRSYTPSNIDLSSEGLELTCSVSTDGLTVPSAGIFTRSKDFFYGSYSARVLLGGAERDIAPGTVTGFFYYKNDTSEIDIEYLSAKKTPGALQYSVKPQQYLFNGAASKATLGNDVVNETSVASNWRFVWGPEAVYYDGGRQVQEENNGSGRRGNITTTTIRTNVPQAPGKIMMNHWSDGNVYFSKGPPERESRMKVEYLQAVYDDAGLLGKELSCVKMKEACLVEGDGVVRGRFAGGNAGLVALAVRVFWSRRG